MNTTRNLDASFLNLGAARLELKAADLSQIGLRRNEASRENMLLVPESILAVFDPNLRGLDDFNISMDEAKRVIGLRVDRLQFNMLNAGDIAALQAYIRPNAMPDSKAITAHDMFRNLVERHNALGTTNDVLLTQALKAECRENVRIREAIGDLLGYKDDDHLEADRMTAAPRAVAIEAMREIDFPERDAHYTMDTLLALMGHELSANASERLESALTSAILRLEDPDPYFGYSSEIGSTVRAVTSLLRGNKGQAPGNVARHFNLDAAGGWAGFSAASQLYATTDGYLTDRIGDDGKSNGTFRTEIAAGEAKADTPFTARQVADFVVRQAPSKEIKFVGVAGQPGAAIADPLAKILVLAAFLAARASTLNDNARMAFVHTQLYGIMNNFHTDTREFKALRGTAVVPVTQDVLDAVLAFVQAPHVGASYLVTTHISFIKSGHHSTANNLGNTYARVCNALGVQGDSNTWNNQVRDGAYLGCHCFSNRMIQAHLMHLQGVGELNDGISIRIHPVPPGYVRYVTLNILMEALNRAGYFERVRQLDRYRRFRAAYEQASKLFDIAAPYAMHMYGVFQQPSPHDLKEMDDGFPLAASINEILPNSTIAQSISFMKSTNNASVNSIADAITTAAFVSNARRMLRRSLGFTRGEED